jgi:hypothetical protein
MLIIANWGWLSLRDGGLVETYGFWYGFRVVEVSESGRRRCRYLTAGESRAASSYWSWQIHMIPNEDAAIWVLVDERMQSCILGTLKKQVIC